MADFFSILFRACSLLCTDSKAGFIIPLGYVCFKIPPFYAEIYRFFNAFRYKTPCRLHRTSQNSYYSSLRNNIWTRQ